MTSKAQQAREDRATAADYLRRILPPGSVVSTLTTRRTDNGADVVPLVAVAGEAVNISWAVARVLGYRLSPVKGGSGVRVDGGGMDLGFHLVHTLGHALYGPATSVLFDSPLAHRTL